MFKRLPFLVILGILAACSTLGTRPPEDPIPVAGTLSSPTPASGVGEASATVTSPPVPSHTPLLSTPTPPSAPLASWTPTAQPSPTPTWTGTPPTPTQLATPYVIEVLDWEIVEASSPDLCAGCDPSVTVIETPRGLGIALVQVFIEGAPGSRSVLTTDLLYTFPEELRCTRQTEDGFCGMVFGQIYGNQLTLSAEHAAGGTHRLEYIVTFQNWARYNP